MRQLDLGRYQLGRDYSIWNIDFAFSASFELAADRLQALLPPNLYLIEPRPGVGLLNVSVFSFTADTTGLTAPCTEVVVSAHVMPNLAISPTLPRLSMYTFRLGATTREFLHSTFATDRYPVYADPLDIRVDRERIAVDVRDRDGRPVLALAAAEGVPARYEHDKFYAQSAASSEGCLWIAGNQFEFRRAENQKNLQRAGTLSPHPFFAPIDLAGVPPPRCHVQMWSEPGSRGQEVHFFLQPAGVRPEGRS